MNDYRTWWRDLFRQVNGIDRIVTWTDMGYCAYVKKWELRLSEIPYDEYDYILEQLWAIREGLA